VRDQVAALCLCGTFTWVKIQPTDVRGFCVALIALAVSYGLWMCGLALPESGHPSLGLVVLTSGFVLGLGMGFAVLAYLVGFMVIVGTKVARGVQAFLTRTRRRAWSLPEARVVVRPRPE